MRYTQTKLLTALTSGLWSRSEQSVKSTSRILPCKQFALAWLPLHRSRFPDSQYRGAELDYPYLPKHRAVTRGDVMFDAKKKRAIPPAHRQLNGTKSTGGPDSTGRSISGANTPLQTSLEIKQKAMTKVVTHFLASRPAIDEDIFTRTNVPSRDRSTILQKCASLDASTQKWTLKDRAYKDIRVWDFKYPRASDREAAIEAAIRAYDRLRLGREDDLWQLLLPKEERNKGKVLSRLHSGPAQKTQMPAIRPAVGQGSSTPLAALGGNASPMPPSIGAAQTASPAASQSTQLGSSTPASRSHLGAMLKSGKRPPARATPNVKESKQPLKEKADMKPSKFKSGEYITESDEDAGVSSGGSTRSNTAPHRSGQPASSKTHPAPAVKSSKGASPPISLLGSDKPKVRKLIKTNSFNGTRPSGSAQSTPSGRAEKHTGKVVGTESGTSGGVTPAQGPVKRRMPSPQGASGRRLAPLDAAAASKETSAVIRKRPLEGSQGTSRPPSASKKRELPQSDNDNAPRPRKVSKVNGSTTAVQDENLVSKHSSSTSLASQRSEAGLKRKADELSRSSYDDYDRQRARKQGRADSSSVTSAATSSSVGTSLSTATTAPTSLGSPSFSAHSPASLADSNTSTSSGDSALVQHPKWTMARALDEAERFQERYYPEYMALYDRVENQGRYARPEDRKQLLALHERLKLMKHNIALAAG